MKALYSLSLTVAVIVLLALGVPAQASKIDARIESTFRMTYVFQTYLKSDDIKIESREGVVTLTGTVSEEFHKSLAQETVAGLPGVKYVDSRLEVKGERPPENSDAWLRMKVKTILYLHSGLRDAKIEVTVKDGIVTLQGNTFDQAQKELTTEYAKDVEGVQSVNNEMSVTQVSVKKRTLGQKIDDASITAQVKMTLLYHRSTSALNTKVETARGVVTLYGKARNASESSLATKLANDVNGVKIVVNRMTIE